MCLEQEIRELKEAVKALTSALTNQPAQTSIPKEESPKEQTPALTADDLQEACLEAVRTKGISKDQVINLLGKYGAKTVRNLDPKHFHEFLERIKSI